jgi:hypothetical protein
VGVHRVDPPLDTSGTAFIVVSSWVRSVRAPSPVEFRSCIARALVILELFVVRIDGSDLEMWFLSAGLWVLSLGGPAFTHYPSKQSPLTQVRSRCATLPCDNPAFGWGASCSAKTVHTWTLYGQLAGWQLATDMSVVGAHIKYLGLSLEQSFAVRKLA